MGAEYNEILPRLWLGSGNASRDRKFMRKNNITAILNCTKDIENTFPDIEYMRIPVDDDLSQDEIRRMKMYIPHAVSFIYKNRVLDKGSVLVHCYAGIQRSAICVLAYLVKTTNLSMNDALRLIISKRPQAFYGGSAINFRRSIQ
uniref:protein-serine/threonine phosphatase n=1 Tax=viral metagenome TaxID=1070528 RepID=A0A6C0M2F9_9ZZZZ